MLEKTLENPLDYKEIQPVNPKGKSTLNIHWKDGCWKSNTVATWCEEPTHLKRPWCWERWKAGGEGVDIGWDGWMASLSQWTWVWGNSGRQWRTGKPGVLQSMGSCSQTQMSNWTTTTPLSLMLCLHHPPPPTTHTHTLLIGFLVPPHLVVFGIEPSFTLSSLSFYCNRSWLKSAFTILTTIQL